jgi:rhamnosyl/mannosyltransferase
VQAIRQRYPGPLLLFVGRLRYYKGLDYLVQAMQRIEATLLVVGTGPEGEHLRALTAELGLSDKIHFLADVGDDALVTYFQAADLFVLPSSHRSEAFGIVLLEAMAAGTPLITTELGTGTSWVNQDGITGRVVPPRDAAALAEAIGALLQNESQRAAMGTRARARAQAEFDLPVLVQRVMDVYHSVL